MKYAIEFDRSNGKKETIYAHWAEDIADIIATDIRNHAINTDSVPYELSIHIKPIETDETDDDGA